MPWIEFVGAIVVPHPARPCSPSRPIRRPTATELCANISWSRGLVQGVGFRYETLRRARRIGVVGWVRNRMDGSVELEVQGEPLRVASMIEWLWQGPEWSRVDDVTVESIPPLGRLEAESTFIVTR